jgi:hypothetical protein
VRQVRDVFNESTKLAAPSIEHDDAPREPYAEPQLTRLGSVADLTEGNVKTGPGFDPGVGSFLTS